MKKKIIFIALLPVVALPFLLHNVSYAADDVNAPSSDERRSNLPQILQALQSEIVGRNSDLQGDIQKLREENRQLNERYNSVSNELSAAVNARKEMADQLSSRVSSNEHLLEKKDELEQKISELLSSDIDIWQVIANKTRVIKEFKDNVVGNTKDKITALEQTLDKTKLTMQEKRQELALAKNKILAKQADKSRKLSELVDARALEITTNLDVVRGELENLSQQHKTELLEKEQLLTILEEGYNDKLEENNHDKLATFEKIDQDFAQELNAFDALLAQDNALVAPLEKEKRELIAVYEEESERLSKDYNIEITELEQQLVELGVEHGSFMTKAKKTFEVLSDEHAITIEESEKELDEVEIYIASINQTAEQRLSVLKRGEELRRQDFNNKQQHLENRIKEIDLAAKEVADNNDDRAYVLNLRKQDVERKMKDATPEFTAVLQAELDVINQQMQALEGIFASVSSANENVKDAFRSTLAAQQKTDQQETQKYQAEYQSVDERRNAIIGEEAQRLERVRAQYESDIAVFEKVRSEYQENTRSAQTTFDDEKAALERELVNAKSDFDAKQNRMNSDYETHLATLNDKLEKNNAKRKEILAKKESIVALTELEKSKKLRNFDLIEQRIKDVYIGERRVVEADINSLIDAFDKKIAKLQARESNLLEDRNSNEEIYQRRKGQLLAAEQKTLDEIKLVENDIDRLETDMERKTLEQISELAKIRDDSVSKFEVSLSNLEQAQLAFENFAQAQETLHSEQRESGEVIDTVMRNFYKITGEPFNEAQAQAQAIIQSGKPAEIPTIPDSIEGVTLPSVTSDGVVAIEDKSLPSVVEGDGLPAITAKKDDAIAVLDDFIQGNQSQTPQTPQPPQGSYQLINGGCYAPDVLEDSQDADTPSNVCVEDFNISKYEVTNADYRRYKKDHNSGEFNGYSVNGNNMPVVNVSWLDALDYAAWLSGQTGDLYRLPTDAEWEYAARGGLLDGETFYPNEQSACFYANIADQSVKKDNPTWDVHDCIDGQAASADVGSYQANGYGLYDMLGNVWEWTCPQYESAAFGDKVCAGINSPTTDLKVSRGGSWFSSPRSVRFGFKYGNYANFKGKHIGFRLVKEAQ